MILSTQEMERDMTNKTNHTPAPWIFDCAEGDPESVGWIATEAENYQGDSLRVIARPEAHHVINPNDGRKMSRLVFDAEDVANVRVMTAAPELLEVVENSVQFIKAAFLAAADDPMMQDAIRMDLLKAESALVKARGKND